MSATSKSIYTKTQACIPKKRPAVDSTFHLLSYGVLGFSWKLISMENGWKECSTLKNSQHLNPKNRSNFLLKHFQANRAKFGTHQKFEKIKKIGRKSDDDKIFKRKSNFSENVRHLNNFGTISQRFHLKILTSSDFRPNFLIFFKNLMNLKFCPICLKVL